jgi:hypothetical protein
MILRLFKSRRQQSFDSFRFNEIHRKYLHNTNGETCWKSVYCKTLGGVTLKRIPGHSVWDLLWTNTGAGVPPSTLVFSCRYRWLR